MGIQGLVKWIQKYSPNAIELINTQDLKNTRMAIDTSTIIYRSALAHRMGGIEMKNNKGDLTSHLYVIFFKTVKLLEWNIIPIYVFDGRSPDSKQETLDKRREIKESAQLIIDKGELTDEEKKKQEQKTFHITNKMKEDLQTMLSLCGIPWIEADGEADPLLAYLNIKGYVDGVIADDTDISVFGAPHQYKNFFEGMKQPNENIIQHIEYEKILNTMKWSRDKYIKLALLLGSDHTPHLSKIGPATAHKLALSTEPLESIAQRLGNEGDRFNLAFKYFRDLIFSDRIHSEISNLKLGPIKKKDLYYFLVNDNQFGEKQVINAIKKISLSIRRIKEMDI